MTEDTARADRGCFIVLEGIDGAGKSEQLRRLASRLRAAGEDVVETCEPTDGPYGRRFRAWARGELDAAPEEVLALFLDDRDAHVATTIRPGLERGAIVLCDRYVASTRAYQAAAGVPLDLLLQRLSERSVPIPDLTLWLCLPVTDALARLGCERERFEQRELLERVVVEYAQLELTRVDAQRSIDDVERAIWQEVQRVLKLRRVFEDVSRKSKP